MQEETITGAQQGRPPARPKGRAQRNPAVTAIQVAFGVLVLGVLVIGSLQAISNSDQEAVVSGVPSGILDLKLESMMTGPEALAEVSKLHGTDIKLNSAIVAHYRLNDTRGQLWVGDAGTEEAAKQLTGLMTERIGKGNGYFSNPKTFKADGRTIYSLSARDGLQHYYYQRGSKVIWLGFPVEDHPDAALKAVLLLVK